MENLTKTDILCGLVSNYNETVKKREPNVAGVVHPLRPNMIASGYVKPGTTVWDAIKEACKSAGVREEFMKRGVAQIGTRDIQRNVTIWRPISQSSWNVRKLEDGELLRFRLLPAGGGGGKNPLRTILTIVVAVAATMVTFGAGSALISGGSALFTSVSAATGAVSLNALGTAVAVMSGLAVSTIGMVLVNAIAPVKAASSLGMSNRSESQVYSLSAGQNSVNQWGRVPVPLGRGRFAPPKAASPYSETVGEDQYIHELLCPGIGDLEISDIKIGTTPIEEFVDVEYEVFKYDPAIGKVSKLYPTGRFQEDLNVQLKAGVWNSRTTAECDKAECDIAFQGLGYFNDKGGVDQRTVTFDVQYKLSEETDWTDVVAPVWVNGKNLTVSTLPASNASGVIAIHKQNGLALFWNGDTVPNGYVVLRKVQGYLREECKWIFEDHGDYVVKKQDCQMIPVISFRDTGTTLNVSGISVNAAQYRRASSIDEALKYGSIFIQPEFQVSGGWYYPPTADDTWAGVISYSGAQSRLMRKTFSLNFPKRGIYDVRWKRRTADSTNDREKTESYWTALKSISTDKPVNTSYPVNLIAIRAKATGQLSGSLGNVTIYYRSQSLDWDRDSRTWVKRFTSNPASIFRHVLQDNIALARPQKDELIDLETLQKAHEWWDDRGGWEWNLVCDASVSVFERLQSICAAGLASPTMVDGKWSVIIDKARDHVACAFTSANAWNWSFERTQVRLPNEIHCTFIDDVTWSTNMQRVATDEPIEAELLTEAQSYEGVNNPYQVYQLARFHYADAKNRRRTINLRCYDEALLCTRGDLVECACPNVSPHGLQVGRVRGIETNEDGYVTAINTDQSNTTDLSGRRFGVRIYATNGVVYHAEVLPENVTQTKLTLLSPQQMDIAEGDKYALGDYSEEVFQAIVLGLKFNTDWTCDVVLQDYVPSLYGNLDEEIPTFYTVVTKEIESKWSLTDIPEIIEVVTDESVLLKNGSTLIPRAALVIKHPNDLDEKVAYMEADYKLSTMEEWVSIGTQLDVEATTIYVQGVEEGQNYDFRVRYTSKIGFVGEYGYAENIRIIGKTSLPPNVQNLVAKIESPSGVRLTWDAVGVLDLSRYRITGPTTVETTATTEVIPVVKRTGTVPFEVIAIDVTGRVSETPATASVEIFPPQEASGFRADTRNDGLYMVWNDCDTTWPIQHYIITDEYLNISSKELRTQTVISPRAVGSYDIGVQPVDIFGNYGPTAEYTLVVSQPSTPAVTTEVNNGVVRLKWQAVSSSFPVKTYQVFSVNGQLLQETAATFFDIDAPAGTLEYRIRAVDSAGNMSAFAESVLQLTAPEAPEVTVSLNKNRDGLDITWNVPDSMLPVLTYDIVRQWDEDMGSGLIETREQDYGSTDATALSVQAIPAGTHTFMVRAVDASGNRSVWGTDTLTVRVPGAAFLTDVNVIDNNVQVYWQEPQDQFFAIAYYNFGTLEDGYFSLIGRIDARFASRFERKSGEYTYQICPVDVAGNVGQCSSITAQVAQPPDFLFFDDKDSTFNGTLVNAELDGKGNMILPVYPDETWQENADRVAGLLATESSNLTWQQKINGGYSRWQSPPAPSGTYTEIVDVGTDVPSTSITVTVSSTVLEGNPHISCKIEVSSDQNDWREMADGSFSTYANSFRYVRYTFTVTGGMVSISAINYRLDVKKQSDFGSVYSNASDNGDGFISVDETPELYGTWVPFLVQFTDVQSGPIAFCNEHGKTAYVSFVDTLHPEGFRVYVLDENGQRTDGQVSWSAFGV